MTRGKTAQFEVEMVQVAIPALRRPSRCRINELQCRETGGVRSMQRAVLVTSLLAGGLACAAWAASADVALAQSASSVPTYDFVDVTLRISAPVAGNPFTDAAVTGWFGPVGASERVNVDGL